MEGLLYICSVNVEMTSGLSRDIQRKCRDAVEIQRGYTQIYIYICIHIYIYTHMDVYIYIYIWTRGHTPPHVS